MGFTSIYYQIKKSGVRFVFWETSSLFRFLTYKKFINFIAVFGQNKLRYPFKLTIDPSANCLLHCPLCPTGQNQKGRLRGEMKFENFKNLLDEIGGYLFEIDLFNWGEPFLNKDIFKMISLCGEKKIITRLSSNLNYFPKGYEKSLVESKLNHLVVSLDGISQESYGKYRINGSFKKVLEAVERIKNEKNKQNSKFPFITWQFIVFDYNKNEMEQARKLVKKWGFDRIIFIENRGDMGKELFVNKKNQPKFKCNFLWSQSVINWDGSVSPCCLYYDQKYDFGNAFKEGFKAVWNNDNYQRARRMVKSGKVIDNKEKNLICFNCLKK